MSTLYQKQAPFYVSRRRRRRSHKRFFLFLVIVILSVTLWLAKKNTVFVTQDVSKIVSPLVGFVTDTKKSDLSLDETINNALLGTTGTYSIVIRDLSTGETYTRNPQETYEAASLYKLWVMVTVYQQIEKGDLTEDEILSADIEELNATFDIASEEAELTEGDISLSVASALQQMITISHNYAALLLSEKVKISRVRAFLQENGLTSSSVGTPPQTTAADVALFYDKLYKGQLASEENTQKMLGLLNQQRLNSKLPKDLPEGVVIAHKTGELGGYSHDGGIVYLSADHAYIIVVMSESTAPTAAEERIAIISKGVYEYFRDK